MKMLALFFVLLLPVATSIDQQIDLSETDSPPCAFESESNAFENGLSSSSEGTRLVANDFVVPANDSFTLQEVAANFFLLSGVQVVNMDVTFYADNNGVPGAILETMTNEIPTGAVIVGDVFTAEIWRVSLTIPNFEFAGQPGLETRYWISVSITNSAGDDQAFWETTSAFLEGMPSAINDNGTGWELFDDGSGFTYDGVYDFIGTCLLGTEDNADLTFSIVPNPTRESISVSLSGPANFNMTDTSGAVIKSGVFSEGIQTVKVGELSSGLYFLNVFNETGITTKKIIKD
jgi:hypothetical protein